MLGPLSYWFKTWWSVSIANHVLINCASTVIYNSPVKGRTSFMFYILLLIVLIHDLNQWYNVCTFNTFFFIIFDAIPSYHLFMDKIKSRLILISWMNCCVIKYYSIYSYFLIILIDLTLYLLPFLPSEKFL